MINCCARVFKYDRELPGEEGYDDEGGGVMETLIRMKVPVRRTNQLSVGLGGLPLRAQIGGLLFAVAILALMRAGLGEQYKHTLGECASHARRSISDSPSASQRWRSQFFISFDGEIVGRRGMDGEFIPVDGNYNGGGAGNY